MALQTLPLLLLTTFIFFYSVSAIDFTFNGFNSSSLLTFGNASIQSSIVSLTNGTDTTGLVLYPHPIPTRPPNSSHLLPFSTSFIFSIHPYQYSRPSQGFAFIFEPTTEIQATNSSNLNSINDANPDSHFFAVEFDVIQNLVSVNVNSLSSRAAHEAGVWRYRSYLTSYFSGIQLNTGSEYKVWIDYFDSYINVTMDYVSEMAKPDRPLINVTIDLSDVFLDQMYVGFRAATGQSLDSYTISSWSFSNSNFSIGDALVTRFQWPSLVPPSNGSLVPSNGSVVRSKGLIVGVSVGGVFLIGCVAVVFVVLLKRKKRQGTVKLEDWELEYWPHRMDYQEIFAATNGFSDKNVIGRGGNGKVYKGVLVGGNEVAIKRISLESEHGMREFMSEVSSLGRLRHKNLVGLRGWCKGEKRSSILVYDYMENGSLDKWLFGCEDSMVLNWEERIKVLKDVACGVLYLHEGWEARVLHRDIKASNVLLDRDMNARLGDFGLARVHNHGELSSMTQVVGTVGYMAPEVFRTGRASTQTDVFSLGVLVLEVVCGRHPIQEGKPGLIDLVLGMTERGELISALDERLKAKGGYSEEEVERVLRLGLLCANPDPSSRPTMRQIMKALEATNEGTESEVEAMDASLLDRMETTMRSNYCCRIGGGHPPHDEMKKSQSSIISLSESDILTEGR